MTLTDAEIQAMRDTLEAESLLDSATIQRASTVNVGGEPVLTWSDLATGVTASLAPVGGGEVGEVGGRISDEATVLITLPAEQDVENADRIVISAKTYDCVLVRKFGELELCRRVEAKEAI